MRQLFYTNYMSGHSGLSNGIMSIEVGVVLAFLTNRFLVLDGNVSPPANVVSYGDRVSNDRPSRVTDLIDLPVAWGEPDGPVDDRDSRELTDFPLWDLVFCYPSSLDISSADARSFAHIRTQWVTVTEELDRIPVLRVSEDPLIPRTESRRRNLSFYSYLFYLDEETRRSVYRLLQRMSPRKPLAELAQRIAGDLGSFNAVHLRRGDFKVTYGVTTLDRQPWEAIEVLDHHFSRQDLLVIVTDERDDPFFDEIKAVYPHHLFIDHHIVDAYESEFLALPHHDSLALAYLSQLITAESQDFIGTMTSTFTSIIQRYRGNRGREEPFKFLWNELPEQGDRLERGRHAISECVSLDRGIMIEEHAGRYSWNRYNRRINPAWMREWPESFLTPDVLTTGALSKASTSTRSLAAIPGGRRGRSAAGSSRVYITFENLQVAIQAESVDLRDRFVRNFDAYDRQPGNVIAELHIERLGGDGHRLARNGHVLVETTSENELLDEVNRQLVSAYTFARRQHTWLRGAAFGRAGLALVVAGDLGGDDNDLPAALISAGWGLLGDDPVPVRVKDCMVLPFGCRFRPEVASADGAPSPTPLVNLVVATHRPHAQDTIARLSPSVAVAELIGTSVDFDFDRDRAVERLCRLVEQRPVAQLLFSRAARAAQLLSELEELPGAGGPPAGAAE